MAAGLPAWPAPPSTTDAWPRSRRSVRVRRAVRSVQPLQLAGQRHRAGGGAVQLGGRRCADRRAATRRCCWRTCASLEARGGAGHALRAEPDAVRRVRDLRRGGRHDVPRVAGPAGGLPRRLRRSAPLLLTFVVIPLTVTAVTPFRYRQVVGTVQDALLTAFIANSVFIVLPMLIENVKELAGARGHGHDRDRLGRRRGGADLVLVPNAGKLLTLLFVPFAAWLGGVRWAPSLRRRCSAPASPATSPRPRSRCLS